MKHEANACNSQASTMKNSPQMTKQLSAQLRNLRAGAPAFMKAFAGMAQAADGKKALETKN